MLYTSKQILRTIKTNNIKKSIISIKGSGIVVRLDHNELMKELAKSSTKLDCEIIHNYLIINVRL